eukprot:m.152028 g.152028  ORF g.152028 m.152028 type:complete len:317 (-) comp17881_c0_seq1:277-1227(-)
MATMTNKYELHQIGTIYSCFKQKFGIPRQPGLAPLAIAELELSPPFNNPDAIRGISEWSHLWITFVFHAIPEEQVAPERFKATIQPPRGDKKYGVFATRTTHRPNRLGLSLCKLAGVLTRNGRVVLQLEGVDLLDETPVLDIKPYLKYAESIPTASHGFTPDVPQTLPVKFTAEAEAQLAACKSTHPAIRDLITQVLSQDPRPTWQKLKLASQPSHHIATLTESNHSDALREKIAGEQLAIQTNQSTSQTAAQSTTDGRTHMPCDEKEYCQYLCDVRLLWRYMTETNNTDTTSFRCIVVHFCGRLDRKDISKMFLK